MSAILLQAVRTCFGNFPAGLTVPLGYADSSYAHVYLAQRLWPVPLSYVLLLAEDVLMEEAQKLLDQCVAAAKKKSKKSRKAESKKESSPCLDWGRWEKSDHAQINNWTGQPYVDYLRWAREYEGKNRERAIEMMYNLLDRDNFKWPSQFVQDLSEPESEVTDESL